eukprot:Tamp_26591.p1 GENE.Tamp_26591~~Tamp_26591.p1  ORF type:complete len:104 (-),score=2.06 Tamp_26591:510-821(-)
MYVCMQSKQALARAKLESCLFSNPKNKERPKPDMHWSILAQQQLICTHVVSFYTREHILYICAHQQTDMHCSILAQQHHAGMIKKHAHTRKETYLYDLKSSSY